jgi:hypothetical protein
MFAGMLIRGAVAAQGHSAFLTRSQMHPARADLYALTTFETRRLFHLRNCGEMATVFFSHGRIILFSNIGEQTRLPIAPSPMAEATRLTEPERTIFCMVSRLNLQITQRPSSRYGSRGISRIFPNLYQSGPGNLRINLCRRSAGRKIFALGVKCQSRSDSLCIFHG